MDKFENLKLFIVLLFVLSITTLIYNFQNPLFRMKLQLILKGYKAEPQATNLESKNKLLSIYRFVTVPTGLPVLPTAQQEPFLEPTSLPQPTAFIPTSTPLPLRNLASNQQTPTPTLQTPGVSSGQNMTQIAWKAIFKGVQAAENPQSGSVSVKIDKDVEYIKRTFTLKDGRQIEVIVPVFKN